MRLILVPAGASLVDEVARILEAGPGPLAEALVVFPGTRPSHFLRRRLAASTGRAFVPPRILSMDKLVAQVVAAKDARTGAVRPALDDVDAVAILHDIQLASPAPLGGTSFMTLDSFFPLGLRLCADLEELAMERVSVRAVAEVQPLVEEEVPARSRQRLQALSHFYESFYAEVAARGFTTRGLRYREAADGFTAEDLGAHGTVVIAGFARLTAAEKAVLHTLAGRPGAVMVAQEGDALAGWLQGLPVDVPPPRAGSPWRFPAENTTFTSSPDAHGQVFALADALGATDDRTVIVVPKAETLFPLLRHALSGLDPKEYSISLRYPMQRTPLHGFFTTLMELVRTMEGESVYLPAYLAFLLHPYVKNVRMGASAEATRVLVHVIEEKLADKATRSFALLSEIESDAEMFARAARRAASDQPEEMARKLAAHLADIHARTVGSFRAFRDVRDFAGRCAALLSWVHDRSTARDHPFFSPFAGKVEQALGALGRSLLAEKSFNDAAGYFALLRRWLGAQNLRFPGTPLRGMQVLGVQETRSLAFERVFVLDANEGAFPSSGTEGSLLPFAVRQALGLQTARDRETEAAYRFSLLAAGARELHVFSVEAGDKERSRFVERLLWEQEKSGRRVAGMVRSAQYDVDLAPGAPATVPKTGEVAAWLRTRSISATNLSAYLQCPLRFYWREVAGLSEREEPRGEVDASQLGTFVHRVLQRFLSARLGRRLAAADLDPAAMSAEVDAVFAQTFGSAEGGASRLLREQARRHLGDFVSGYLRPLAEKEVLVVRAVEHNASGAWRGFALNGRIDAVLERAGRPVLVDFKTSAAAGNYSVKWRKLDVDDRATWSAAIPTMQLPFYLLLRSLETGEAPASMEAMFLLLGKTQVDSGIELPLFDGKAATPARWPDLERVLHALLEEIVSPDVPFSPAADLKAACAWCDFTALCGTAAYAKK